jgi:post-segregation antitoxin (ccd killing protein)
MPALSPGQALPSAPDDQTLEDAMDTTTPVPAQSTDSSDGHNAEAARALQAQLALYGTPGDSEQYLGTALWIESHGAGYIFTGRWRSQLNSFAMELQEKEKGGGFFHISPLNPEKTLWWIGDADKGTFLDRMKFGDNTLAVMRTYTQGAELPKWKFEEGPVGTFYIKHRDTYEYLHWTGRLDDTFPSTLELLPTKQENNPFLWDLWPKPEKYTSPAVRRPRTAPKHPDYGAPPEQTSLDEPWERTDLKFIGETPLPAAVVKDGDRDLAWKMRNSPYYMLRRYSQWKRTKFATYDGFSQQLHSVTYDYGVTKSTSQTIENNLNISVTAEAGFSFKGIGVNVSGTVAYGLSVSTTTQWEESYSKSETYETTYPSNDGKAYAIADWERRDVYSLVRAENGKPVPDDEVLRWEVTVPGVHIARSFQAPDPIDPTEWAVVGPVNIRGQVESGGRTFDYWEIRKGARRLGISVQGVADSATEYQPRPEPHNNPPYNKPGGAAAFYEDAAQCAADHYDPDSGWPRDGGTFTWKRETYRLNRWT